MPRNALLRGSWIQPEVLPVYDRCEPVSYMERAEYVPKVLAGELLPVGNQRRIKALHIIHRGHEELKGPVPAGKRFHFLEALDGCRVYQHAKRALQPCPDRDALLTGAVRP